MERDDINARFNKDKNPFQSTLSHGERQYSQVVIYSIERFQSTLSHGERLLPRR